jgi:alpha-1,6-mannosyltransferase
MRRRFHAILICSEQLGLSFRGKILGVETPLRARDLWRYSVTGLASGLLVVVGSMLGGAAFVSNLAGAWFYGTPGSIFGNLPVQGSVPPAISMLLVFGGLIVLIRTWLSLMASLRRTPGVPVKAILIVIAIWVVPFLIAPPLFSRDIFSYAAQGEMVTHHISPYLYGPGVLGSTPFNIFAGPVWANTPSPYGPLVLALDGLTTSISGHQLLGDLVLLRAVALIGYLLVVISLPTLARAWRKDPAEILVLGAASPLVLVTFIGGAHNDALMVGLLVAALAISKRFGTVPALIVCALAVGVKAPAGLGVLFLGWNWAGPLASVATRVKRTAVAGVISLCTLAVVTTLSGLGWGWLRTISGGSAVFTGVTPVDFVSHVVTLLLAIFGIHGNLNDISAVFHVLGLITAAAIAFVLLRRSPHLGVDKALGLALLSLALFGPILWAWYLTWGVVTLAPVMSGRLRNAVVAISIGGTLVGATSVLGIARAFAASPIVADLLLPVGLIACTILPLYWLETRGYAALDQPGAQRPVWSKLSSPRAVLALLNDQAQTDSH